MRFSGSVKVSNFLVWVIKACGDQLDFDFGARWNKPSLSHGSSFMTRKKTGAY